MKAQIIQGSQTDFLETIEKHLRHTLNSMKEEDKEYAFYLGNYNIVAALLGSEYGKPVTLTFNYDFVKRAFQSSQKDFEPKDKKLDKLKAILDEIFDDEDDEDECEDDNNSQMSLDEIFPEIFEKLNKKVKKSPKNTEKSTKKE